MTKWRHFVIRQFGVQTDNIFWHKCRMFWHPCCISNLKNLKICWFRKTKSKKSADFVRWNQKNVSEKNDFPYKSYLIMTTAEETLCLVRRNSKNGCHIQKASKTDFIRQHNHNHKTKSGNWTVNENWTYVSLYHLAYPHIAFALFKHIIVNNNARTSKQKLPFMSNQKMDTFLLQPGHIHV